MQQKQETYIHLPFLASVVVDLPVAQSLKHKHNPDNTKVSANKHNPDNKHNSHRECKKGNRDGSKSVIYFP